MNWDGPHFTIHAIKFFHHGTLDVKTVFADSGLTIPHAHTVFTDANGQLPQIFFDDNNWPYTTDAETTNVYGKVIAKFSPLGLEACLRRGFGER